MKLKRKRKNRQKDEPIAVVRQERIRPVGNDGGAVGTDVTDGAFEEGIGN